MYFELIELLMASQRQNDVLLKKCEEQKTGLLNENVQTRELDES